MKLVDLNVLMNALNTRSVDHDVSVAWLQRNLSGESPVGFAWLVLVGFIRLTTSQRVLDAPLAHDQSVDVVRGMLARRSAYVVHPTTRHLDVVSDLLNGAGAAGNLTNDAHLAALAVEHKASVVTFDADFDRFPGVRWERPS